jgi:fibronectin type 3 domain-containing protein
MVGRIILFAVILSLIGIQTGNMDDGSARGDGVVEMVSDPHIGGDIAFTENKGQWDEEVLFRCDWGGGSSWFTRTGVTHLLSEGDRTASARIDFVNGAWSEPVGTQDLGYDTNFFYCDISVSGARSYSGIVYEDVWPDIDIIYRSERGSLKYDIIVGEWADPDQILLEVSGHRALIKDDDSLEIVLTDGIDLIDADLISFDDSCKTVRSEFRIVDDRTYGFDVEKDPGTSIVIDPMLYSTYFGGSYDDDGEIFIDDDGYLFIAGTTNSADLPIVGGVQGALKKWSDIYVTKMVPNGSSIVFSTYIGGSQWDTLSAFTVDENGNIFITGFTNSMDYPTTSGAFQEVNKNTLYTDIFITKLNTSGDKLLYSTYVSGDWYESSSDIDILDGCAIICGIMESHDFPTEDGPRGGVHGTAFYLQMDSNGSAIADTCFWDTGGMERAESLDVDINGDVVIGGTAYDPSFPVSPGAYRSDPANMTGPLFFILKYSPSTGTTVFSSLLGDRSNDMFGDLCTDKNGDILFAGNTRGYLGSFFPTTKGAYDTKLNGSIDAVVGKLSGNGTTLLFSTLLGGDADEMITAIDTDSDGCPYVTGYTTSATGLPVTSNSLDRTFNGIEDAFVAKMDRSGSSLPYMTYLGGTDEDRGMSIFLMKSGDMAFGGYTRSTDLPVTNGSYQSVNRGNMDAFLTILDFISAPSAPINLTAVSGDSVIVLKWDAPENDGGSNVTDYMVYKGIDSTNLSLHATLGDVRDYNDTDLVIGRTYYYAISCRNGVGESDPSDIVSNRSITLPGPPTNVSANVYSSSITISWSPPVFAGGCDITHYDLFRGDSGTNLSLISTLDGTSNIFIDPDVEDSKIYYYSLTASNCLGDSPHSTLKTRMAGPPSVPRNLSGTYSDESIILDWDVPEDLMGLPLLTYKIYRWMDGEDPSLLTTISSLYTIHTDGSLTNGQTYYYKVTAQNVKGESDPSNTIDSVPMTYPSPPLYLQTSWAGAFLSISWSPPKDDGGSPVLEYGIYYAPEEGGYTWIGSSPVIGNESTYIHSIEFQSVVRYYYVTAVNVVGESSPSKIVKVTPPTLPGAPTDVIIMPGDGNALIEWESPINDGGAEIIGYKVYRWIGTQENISCIATLGPHQLDLFDRPLRNGIEYSYVVRAMNIVGEGAGSDPVSAIPMMELGPISELRAISVGGVIELSWASPFNDGSILVTGYYIYRSSGDPGSSMEKIDQTNSVRYTDLLVERGRSYAYLVTPFTDHMEGPIGVVVEVKCLGHPDRPSTIWANWMNGRVVLQWSNPSMDGGSVITHFTVLRYKGSLSQDLALNTSHLEYMDTNITPGSTYTYHVIAVNSQGTSPPIEVTIQIPIEERNEPEKDSFNWILVSIPALLLIILVLSILLWRSSRTDVWEE